MGATHPAGKFGGEVVLVVNDILQDDIEEALPVDEFLGVLEWAEEEDVYTVHGPNAV